MAWNDDINLWINEKYPDCQIVKLKDLTEKISGVSKVRIGSEATRTINSYYEITLNEINEEGLISLTEDVKKVEPANGTAMNTQNLKLDDIVFSKSFTKNKSIKIGRMYKVDKNFVIANNSMIRISFPKMKQEHLPKFIQFYLQHPKIQDYLYKLTRSDKRQVQLSVLRELPIPVLSKSELYKVTTSIDENFLSVKQANMLVVKANEILKLQKNIQNESIFTTSEKNDCDIEDIYAKLTECIDSTNQ